MSQSGRSSNAARVDILEPRTFLSAARFLSRLIEPPLLTPALDALYADSRDAYNRMHQSTDGSIAELNYLSINENADLLTPWNGGLLSVRSSASNSGVTFIAGRQSATFIDLPTKAGEQLGAGTAPITVGKTTYFSGGSALLRGDGTLSIPTTVKTFADKTVSTIIRAPDGSHILFRANAGLYVSDGTAAGTSLLADAVNDQLVLAGPYIYFQKYDSRKGEELWRTDGNAGGTTRVADLLRGLEGSAAAPLAALGDKLLFRTTNAKLKGLWITDGTEAGTQKLSNLDTFTPATTYVAGRRALLLGDAGHPWFTDGTPAGTVDGLSFLPFTPPTFTNPIVATVMNGKFQIAGPVSDNNNSRVDLWRTDGTRAHSALAGSLNPWLHPADMLTGATAFNGAVYLSARGPNNGSPSDNIPNAPYLTVRMSDETASINGEAFYDADADLAHDLSERALKGVRIYIDANNNRAFDEGERSALTDSHGRYAFANLPLDKKYRLRQEAPAGSHGTSPAYTVSLTRGDHAIKTFGSVANAPLLVGKVSSERGAIGGLAVYVDLDKNGRRDRTEPMATTDAGGRYAFAQLAAGKYNVRPTLQTGYAAVGDAVKTVVLDKGAVVTADFSQRKPATLVISISNDSNGDARLSSKETIVKGLPATFTFTGGTVGPTTITANPDADGHYNFTLPPDSYSEPTVTASGWRQTTNYEVTDRSFTLKGGESTSVTVTLTKRATVHIKPFVDRDADGKHDDNEGFYDGFSRVDLYVDVNHDGKFSGTFSSSDSLYYGIPPGTYDAKINTSIVLTTPATFTITIRGGEESVFEVGLKV